MSNRSTVEQARRDGYCPACGYRTLGEGGTGSWMICPICFWEDEPYPLDEPDTVMGGPNGGLSLNDARANVERFGEVLEGGSDHTCDPDPDTDRHPDWPFTE